MLDPLPSFPLVSLNPCAQVESLFDLLAPHTAQPTEDNIVKIGIHGEGYTYSANTDRTWLPNTTRNATSMKKDMVSKLSSISTPRTVRTHGERGLDIPLEMVQLLRAELRRVYPELADLPFKSTRMCWYARYFTLVGHPPAKLSGRSVLISNDNLWELTTGLAGMQILAMRIG